MPGFMSRLSWPATLMPPLYTPGSRTYRVPPPTWGIAWTAVCGKFWGVIVVLFGGGRNRYGSGVGGTPTSIGPMKFTPCVPPAYPPVMLNCSDRIEFPVPDEYMAVGLLELTMTAAEGTSATAPPPSLSELG